MNEVEQAKILKAALGLFEKVFSKRLTEHLKENVQPGPRGEKGDTGDMGPKGDKGDKGDPGPIGLQGEKGLPGKDGRDGVDGKDGRDGLDGKDGDQGPQGDKGERGDPGLDGKDGNQGPKGEKGDQGPKGEKGDPGEPGVDGKDGRDGLDGKDGRDGVDGVNGKDGEKGEKGDKGDPGEPGPPGKDIDSKKLEDFEKLYEEHEKLKKDFNNYRNLVNQQMGSIGGGGSVKILDNDDVVFQKRHEVEGNAILIFDKDINKFKSESFTDIIERLKVDLEVQYDKLIFETTANNVSYTYVGEATPGAVVSDPVWRIKRVAEYSDGLTEVLWANDSVEFDKVWDDRESYTYDS